MNSIFLHRSVVGKTQKKKKGKKKKRKEAPCIEIMFAEPKENVNC